MSEPNTSDATDKKVPPKRSVIERCIVWSGILILLGVVVVEWTSMRNFAATMEDFESALHASHSSKDAAELNVADLDRYVHGFAFRTEVKKLKDGQRTFQWPSLFKYYKLGVSYYEDGSVYVVDTIGPDVVSEIKPPQ